MNYWAVTLLLLLGYTVNAQSKPFTVQGIIRDAPVSVIYLKHVNEIGQDILDSARIQNGAFTFTGDIHHPTRAFLRTNRKIMPDDQNLNITPLYLEPATITVELTYNQFRNIKVNGSKTHAEFAQSEALQTPFRNEYFALRDSLERLNKQGSATGNQAQVDSLNRRMEQAIQGMCSASRRFIADHPDSWASAYELNLFKNDFPIDSVRSLFYGFTPALKQSQYGLEIADKLARHDQVAASLGKPYINFASKDVNGQAFKLSSLKGGYILLDFWGSWCAPCRAGNPHLVELYKRYHQKGIEFVGIACDDTPAAWKKAIEKDGIGIWRHVLDQKTTGIARQYAIDVYPTKILVDPAGRMVARYQGNDDTALAKKLEELLAQGNK